MVICTFTTLNTDKEPKIECKNGRKKNVGI